MQHIGNVYELAKLLFFSHLLLIPVLKIPQRASEFFFSHIAQNDRNAGRFSLRMSITWVCFPLSVLAVSAAT